MHFKLDKAELGRIVRFGVVGTTCTLIHYGIYLLLLLRFNPTIAYTGGYIVGFCCNYVFTTYFTFRQKSSIKNMVGFSFGHVINYFLEIGVLNLLIYLGIGENLSGIVTLVVVVPINFLILRIVYFLKR